MKRAAALRALPSVESVLERAELATILSRAPRTLVVEAVRGVLAEHRARLRGTAAGGPGPRLPTPPRRRVRLRRAWSGASSRACAPCSTPPA